jgi:protein SCO1/2
MRERYMKRFRGFLLWLTLGALAFGEALGQAQEKAATPGCCAKTNIVSAGKALTDGSIYQVDSKWTDDRGQEMKLEGLRGKVQVLVMFFASCEFTCPALVHDMKKIEGAVPPEVRKNLHFTLVSFDTQRDTVAALRDFRKRMDLTEADWTLLRGNPDDVLELAALLGVKFKKDARGQFSHSNIITILDQHGEIAYQQIGINQDIQPAADAITRNASAISTVTRKVDDHSEHRR